MKIAYGLTNFDKLMESICIARLSTGEMIIAFTQKFAEERSYVFVCPFEIKESTENPEDIYLIPFIPYFTDNTFKFFEVDLHFCKNTVSDYVKSAYRKQATMMYSDILEELKTVCDMNDRDYMTELKYVEPTTDQEKEKGLTPPSIVLH